MKPTVVDAAAPLVIYPGSFDPLTCGHLNLIQRGVQIYRRLQVAVAHNPRKTPLFSAAERVAMIQEALPATLQQQVQVCSFAGLLTTYAQQCGAQLILRGLRASSDFEFEFQLAHVNRRLGAGLETIFMMTGEAHFYVSSGLVREIAQFGGNLTGLVPASIAQRLQAKFTGEA